MKMTIKETQDILYTSVKIKMGRHSQIYDELFCTIQYNLTMNSKLVAIEMAIMPLFRKYAMTCSLTRTIHPTVITPHKNCVTFGIIHHITYSVFLKWLYNCLFHRLSRIFHQGTYREQPVPPWVGISSEHQMLPSYHKTHPNFMSIFLRKKMRLMVWKIR